MLPSSSRPDGAAGSEEIGVDSPAATGTSRSRVPKKVGLPIWLGAVIGVITVAALYRQVFGPHTEYITDVYEHLLVVRDMGPSGPWHLYSLFFPLVYALSLGSKSYTVIAIVAIVVITISVIAKGLITYFVVLEAAANRKLAMLLALALLVVAPLPNWWKPEYIYLDKIAPNIWFNSTAMLAMPFALLLFYAAVRWLKERSMRSFAWVVLFSTLSVLTKPNFVLAFLPLLGVAGVILLIHASIAQRWKPLREVVLIGALLVAVCAMLYAQSAAPVSAGPTGNPNGTLEDVRVIVAPFEVWRLYSPNIPISLLLSIAFPLGVAVLYFKEVKTATSVLLAWAVFVVAIAQYVLLAEAGRRFTDANWIWGSNIAAYLLFVVSTVTLLSRPRTRRFYFLIAILALHVCSGVFYYARIALGLGFY